MTIYLKYEGIDGDVTSNGFEKFIEVHSAQLGVGRGISSTHGRGEGVREASIPSISELVVTKTFDRSSSLLIQQALKGPLDKKVELHFVRTQGGKAEAYLVYKFEQCAVSGYSLSSGGDRPSESISINFAKFETKNIEVKDKLTAAGGVISYDLRAAKGA
ncbi:type VI secretion system tube protein Hcp [Roseomonas sp. NAR14]|uniref:Type VI secretion system tube protein Hcp n=1 Tax=Roseomonas acroporae TaxID=2937791 RepID=A0A9X1Y8E8_9PROT|nr:type VI secretion system tube protein Hcp [Roseomonas acroporae]MCK8785138.1 type VI secretion system tube protein Hcp [Roseomonas acroporae]